MSGQLQQVACFTKHANYAKCSLAAEAQRGTFSSDVVILSVILLIRSVGLSGAVIQG